MKLLDIKVFYLKEYIVGKTRNRNKQFKKHQDECLIQSALYIVGELPY